MLALAGGILCQNQIANTIVNNTPMKKILFITFLISISFLGHAQNSQCDQLTNEGFEYLKQGNLSLAIDKYNAALKIDSNKLEAHMGLAWLILRLAYKMGGIVR